MTPKAEEVTEVFGSPERGVFSALSDLAQPGRSETGGVSTVKRASSWVVFQGDRSCSITTPRSLKPSLKEPLNRPGFGDGFSRFSSCGKEAGSIIERDNPTRGEGEELGLVGNLHAGC
jgi:hypothetical protein